MPYRGGPNYARLRAAWVIHTVGPVWHSGDDREDALLAGCYRASLELAVQHVARTVAFPAISAGAYGFPIGRAARIAVTEARAFLQQDDSIRKMVFVCFSKTAYQSYLTAVKEVVGWAYTGRVYPAMTGVFVPSVLYVLLLGAHSPDPLPQRAAPCGLPLGPGEALSVSLAVGNAILPVARASGLDATTRRGSPGCRA